jgi:Flp pilus assembly pilin Flp
MERIKRFWLDESATAEASSTVIMIAFVGLLLAAGFAVYYGAMNTFFNTVGGKMENYGRWLGRRFGITSPRLPRSQREPGRLNFPGCTGGATTGRPGLD